MGFFEIALAVAVGVFVGKAVYSFVVGFSSELFRK